MIDLEHARELHQEAFAYRTRVTLGTVLVCLTVGAIATWLTVTALPLMGFIIGFLSLAATILLPVIAWSLTDPASTDFAEFAEIIAESEEFQSRE